ncbi:ABC transporter G family member 36 [Coccomyxa sp. Obi]|nr:ABC transporter G family member 36 [Coccomyxa sp. Obi]
MEADESNAATLRRRFAEHEPVEVEHSGLTMRALHAFLPSNDLLRPDETAGPAAITRDEQALMAAVHSEDTKSRRRAAKLAKRQERAERKAQKRAQQVQQMEQYDKGGYLLRVIASKAKPTSVVERQSKLKRPELLRYASRVMKLGQEGESFLQKLNRLFTEAGGVLPSITIEYRDMQIEADALVGTAAVPSLTQSFWGFVKDVLRITEMRTAPLRTLSISGKLNPGRLTLLMGPPQSGKSLFMHMLAGRLQRSKFLRIKGNVLYNGRHAKEFNMARAIAMVDQIDEHIPILTVRETLEFAHMCQNGFGNLEFNLVDEMRRVRGQSRELQAQLLQAHVQHEAALRALDEHVSMRTEPDSEAFDDSSTEISSMPSTPAHSLQTEALRPQLSQPSPGPPEKDSDDEFEQLLAKVWGTGVRMEILMQVMGLARVADTKVGSALVRGVSGGERKRVTSAEMLVGPKKVLLMDEISTGLDSATTYTVVQYLRNATHHMHLTTLVSLLQPAPEVYNLFDDVLLLTDGQLMFHGPVAEALPFFASLGFECPVRKDPASFLQEVTTPKGQLLYASEKLRAERGLDRKGKEALGSGRLLVGCAEISAAFWDTPWGRAMRDELDNKPFRPEDGHPSALPKKAFALTWWQAVGVLLNRQWKLTVRDSALVRGRIIQVVVMAFIIGSLFNGQRPTALDARNYFGVSFLSMMFLSMGAMPEMGITFANKPVTFKQRDNRFFPPSAYALALLLVRIPFQLVEAALFTLVVYFWVGFHAAPGTFFIFYLICIATMLQMSAVYRLLASASPNTDIGTAAGGVVLLVLIVTSGFAIIRTAIPPWWIWAYWISPFAYGLRAIVVNEMTSAGWSYSDATTPPGSTVGIQALESFGFQTEQMWIWIGIGYNVGLALLLSILSGLALQYSNPVKMRPTTAADESAAKSAAISAELRKKRTERLIKSRRFRKVHAAVDVEAKGADAEVDLVSSLPFTPITLVYRDLQYFVAMPGKKQVGEDGKRKRLELLKPMSGAAVPGQLTALMGGSGAGKTTLMDVIAGRKTQGEIKGEILVNGFPKEQRSWARVVGYVEQNDIHTPQVIVREALEFSARLRISESAGIKQIEEYVDEVLDIVELTPLKDSLVGIPGISGLSVEQRKRLTIAVELVANPSVIFMDEPTSGLDARAAAIVMQSVKNVSKNGRTVMVTIHQPSIDIFEAFDALVLLQRGGKLIYSGPLGPESSALIAYLEAVPGVHPIRAGENPATWMLEVTGGASITGKSKAASVDFAEYYKMSELHRQNEALIEELARQGKQQGSRLSLKGTYATRRSTQFVALARKYRLSYWRSPSYNLTRMLMTLLICLFYGTMFWGRGRLPATGADIGSVQNVMGVLYSATNFQGMFNLMNVLPIVGFERGVFYRERAALMYAHLPYISSVAFVELPYLLAQVLVFVPISYFMIGFKLSAASFFYFFLMFLLDLALFTYFGQFLVFLTPSQGLAQIIASAVQTLWSIFNGFMLPYPLMPMGWKWLNRISPATWIIYGLAVDQMGENTDQLITPEGEITTVKAFLTSYFGYEHSFRWNCTAIIIAYIFVFRIGSILSVRFISYQRR